MLGKEKECSTELAPFLDSILDIMSDGIYISDANGKTCKVNRVYTQLTGFKEEELIGRLVTDLIAEGKYNVALNPEIVRTGKPKTSVQITQTGRRVILNGYPVFNSNGKVALVVTFVRDITLLTQMQDQLALQQDLIEKFTKDRQTPVLIAESIEMQKLLSTLESIAITDATVLLLGETGVGKDVMARSIHAASPRSHEPFFKVDCAGIPANLMETELFGYDAGAFSGASAKGKPGFFEMAHKGTLFLDEIGELPFLMQAKLLRVLQDREILRVGSTKTKKIDTRIIAATNRNLEAAVKEGMFRADLYYRLRVAVLTIPSLRDRKRDILPLTNYFLDKFRHKYNKKISFSQEVHQVLQQYSWPGNVREMENLIQSLVITTSKEVVDIVDLPYNMLPSAATATANKSLNEIIDEIEADLIRKAYHSQGSVADVAKFFKVDRSTIFRKMKKYSII